MLALPRITVERLVLIEPALYDVARGDPAIERHVGAMERARARLAEGDLRDCWEIVRPLMFGSEFDPLAWDAERERAEAFAAVPSPWGHGIEAAAIAGIPTLVVTGGWNAEYEAIAQALAAAGADHRVLEGAGHRPQDLPGLARLLEA
jgi:hypothetical protein